MDEETAYHEAGHAMMAILLGGRIESLTIAPEQDEIQRYGEIKISWPGDLMVGQKKYELTILSALAGPVAEMIIIGEKRHPAFVAEWKHDWEIAWDAASELVADEKQRLAFLEKLTLDLHARISRDDHWAALAAVVDHLLAYENLEDDEVREVMLAWLPS